MPSTSGIWKTTTAGTYFTDKLGRDLSRDIIPFKHYRRPAQHKRHVGSGRDLLFSRRLFYASLIVYVERGFTKIDSYEKLDLFADYSSLESQFIDQTSDDVCILWKKIGKLVVKERFKHTGLKVKHGIWRDVPRQVKLSEYPIEFQEELDYIEELKDGWGGENEPAPSKDTVRKVHNVVNAIVKWCRELEYEPLYPELIPGNSGQIELSYSLGTKDFLVEIPNTPSLRMRVLLGFKDRQGKILNVETTATHSLSDIRHFLEQFIGR